MKKGLKTNENEGEESRLRTALNLREDRIWETNQAGPFFRSPTNFFQPLPSNHPSTANIFPPPPISSCPPPQTIMPYTIVYPDDAPLAVDSSTIAVNQGAKAIKKTHTHTRTHTLTKTQH